MNVVRRLCRYPAFLLDHIALQQHLQRLIQAVSPVHGRALIYVWAIEQDELSKRVIPGQDVFVPWVLATQTTKPQKGATVKKYQSAVEPAVGAGGAEGTSKVLNRYYHMFTKGELCELTTSAAQELDLAIGNESDVTGDQGIEIVQCGWERSNYYIEIRRWRR